MKSETCRLLLALFVPAILMVGCASYRTDSNISASPVPMNSSAGIPSKKVLISENSLPGRKYQVIGPVEVSVKKLTVFHNDPTKEQANVALIEKALVIGADAVINVKYESGIGFTTWGYIDANGSGVKLTE